VTFRALCGDSPDLLTTVARFLALLELFRENTVAFEQVTPLGELSVRWTGGDELDVEAELERIDEFDGTPEPSGEAPSAEPGESPDPTPIDEETP
jgi:segregation and condensation protein A